MGQGRGAYETFEDTKRHSKIFKKTSMAFHLRYVSFACKAEGRTTSKGGGRRRKSNSPSLNCGELLLDVLREGCPAGS